MIREDGEPKGAPIEKPKFYSALMRVWLGRWLADPQSKGARLSKAPAPATGGSTYS